MDGGDMRSVISAVRVEDRQFSKRSSNPAATSGLRYERKFAKALSQLGYLVERNPWFAYQTSDSDKINVCSPDILFSPPLSLGMSLGSLIVIEVKQTYIPSAIDKVRRLYIPVVKLCVGRSQCNDIRALIVVQKLTPSSPPAAFSVREALLLDPPVMQWLGSGSVVL